MGGARTFALRSRCAKTIRCSGCIRHLPPGSSAVLRQADRAAAELRRAGGHRDGECAAHDRDARGVGAADRDRRGIAGHQFARPATSRRCSTRCSKRRCGCARPRLAVCSPMTRRAVPAASPARRAAGFAGIASAAGPPHAVPGSLGGSHASTANGSFTCRRYRPTRRPTVSGQPARFRALVESAELRTLIGVPLRKDGSTARRHQHVTARRCGRSPTSRSRCCRISPRRR